jgi:alkylated DNA repair dioxygenase AlkB
VYLPAFVDSQSSRQWFRDLRDAVPWQSERRRMYDRDVDVPRLVARYQLDDAALPPALGEAAGRVGQATGTPFNSAGLNYYRDGRDSVAPHRTTIISTRSSRPIRSHWSRSARHGS